MTQAERVRETQPAETAGGFPPENFEIEYEIYLPNGPPRSHRRINQIQEAAVETTNRRNFNLASPYRMAKWLAQIGFGASFREFRVVNPQSHRADRRAVNARILMGEAFRFRV